MSGHSKWSQIKHQKGVADQKRGQLFGKLSRFITLAARTAGSDPAFNPALQGAIERARAFNMPKDNIERAIKRATEKEAASLDEVLVQAIGPGGAAIIIKAITDNRNRTIAELRTILSQHQAKLVNPGSLNWMFDQNWNATTPANITAPAIKTQLDKLFEELDNQAEVEDIYSNVL